MVKGSRDFRRLSRQAGLRPVAYFVLPPTPQWPFAPEHSSLGLPLSWLRPSSLRQHLRYTKSLLRPRA